jgi:hypothetical protein
MNTSHRWFFVASLGIAAAAAVAAACAAPTPGIGSGESNVESDDLEVVFSPAYSAYDGEHEFKIPLKVDGVKNLKWSASDPDMVDLDPQSNGMVMVTARKAGKVTITAKNGSLSGKTELHITDADAEEWEAGNQRYNSGIILERKRGDGGWDGGNRDQPKEQRPAACTQCHANGQEDVEHTPMQTGGYSDEQLVDIMTKGKKPAGAEFRIRTQRWYENNHRWSMTEFEQKGLIVYLRSLEPKSQGPVDWGGRGGGKGGRDGGRSQ